jgi:hypothetical protein
VFEELGLDDAIDLFDVTLMQGDKDRALVREVLVDRTDAAPATSTISVKSLLPARCSAVGRLVH